MPQKCDVVFEKVRAEMARRHITVGELADIAGCNRDAMARKLAGKVRMSLSQAAAIGGYLFPGMDLRAVFAECYIKRQ